MNALIVDDELPNREGLSLLLRKTCPDVDHIGLAASAQEARDLLIAKPYDIVFLDINMPNENGFELLKSLPAHRFSVVFVTAYSEFAVRAFRANAIDYLLKPVDTEELIAAVAKCKERLPLHQSGDHLSMTFAETLAGLQVGIEKHEYPTRITLPHQMGFNIVETGDIIWIEADGNYSRLHLTGGKNLLVTRAIREFEFLLDPAVFFRSHKSALINLRQLREYNSTDGHMALMNNGERVPISRRKLVEFMAVIDALSKRV